MTEDEARTLTDQIIGHAEQLWLLVVKAWRRGVDRARLRGLAVLLHSRV